MDINDLKQENSRKIAEEVIKSLKLDEDSGVGITGNFIFSFEKDDVSVRTMTHASAPTILQLMDNLFEILQENSPAAAYLAKGILGGEFSQKKDAD